MSDQLATELSEPDRPRVVPLIGAIAIVAGLSGLMNSLSIWTHDWLIPISAAAGMGCLWLAFEQARSLVKGEHRSSDAGGVPRADALGLAVAVGAVVVVLWFVLFFGAQGPGF